MTLSDEELAAMRERNKRAQSLDILIVSARTSPTADGWANALHNVKTLELLDLLTPDNAALLTEVDRLRNENAQLLHGARLDAIEADRLRADVLFAQSEQSKINQAFDMAVAERDRLRAENVAMRPVVEAVAETGAIRSGTFDTAKVGPILFSANDNLPEIRAQARALLAKEE